MQEIKRPAGLYVPRQVQFRIDAAQALSSGNREDLMEVAKKYDIDVAEDASDDALAFAVRSGSAVGSTGRIVEAPAQPAEPQGEVEWNG